jgi:transposase-like protein
MSELSPIQNKVIAALVAGKSISAAARENGIHRSTIYDWRNQHPKFKSVLDEARARQQIVLRDFVRELAEQALETVEASLTAPEPEVRLRAAQIILRIASPTH